MLSTSVPPRVLSVQSQVVHGCVGNSASVFPLQLNGIIVDPLNVLSFSNHTGYPHFSGHRLDAGQVKTLIDGLRTNGFLAAGSYQYLHSGYIGNPSVMAEVAALAQEMKTTATATATTATGTQEEVSTATTPAASAASNDAVVYVCDPVCGDCGQLYVSADCLDAYRMQLLPLATIALPNGFEASTLSGINITSQASAMAAADWFHGVGVPLVVIKSYADAARDTSADQSTIFMLISAIPNTADDKEKTPSGTSVTPQRWEIQVAGIDGYFVGTGDLFASLLLSAFARHRHNSNSSSSSSSSPALVNSAENIQIFAQCAAAAAAATRDVLLETSAVGAPNVARGKSTAAAFNSRELPIVRCQQRLRMDDIAGAATAGTLRPLQ